MTTLKVEVTMDVPDDIDAERLEEAVLDLLRYPLHLTDKNNGKQIMFNWAESINVNKDEK